MARSLSLGFKSCSWPRKNETKQSEGKKTARLAAVIAEIRTRGRGARSANTSTVLGCLHFVNFVEVKVRLDKGWTLLCGVEHCDLKSQAVMSSDGNICIFSSEKKIHDEPLVTLNVLLEQKTRQQQKPIILFWMLLFSKTAEFWGDCNGSTISRCWFLEPSSPSSSSSAIHRSWHQFRCCQKFGYRCEWINCSASQLFAPGSNCPASEVRRPSLSCNRLWLGLACLCLNMSS